MIRYSQQSDFRQDIIKGSMLTQRRKTVTWEMFRANVHSPLFLDRKDKTLTHTPRASLMVLESIVFWAFIPSVTIE